MSGKFQKKRAGGRMGKVSARFALSGFFLFLSISVFCAESESFIVSALKVRAVSASEFRLSWELPAREVSALRVYRSSSPIRDVSSLTQDNFLVELPPQTAEFRDAADGQGAVFYAVITVFDGAAFELVVPSLNASESAVFPLIQEKSSADATGAQQNNARIFGNRPIPLPALAGPPQKNSVLPKEPVQKELSLAASAKTERLMPFVFLQEQTPSQSGESFLLYDIIVNFFDAGRYADALEKLNEFLRLKRSYELTARAEFYRGECSYFLGDYRTAVNCFLFTKTAHPELSTKWLDAALMEITIDSQESL